MTIAQKNSRPAKTSFIGVLRRAAFVAPNSFYQALYVQVLNASFVDRQTEITVVGRFGDLTVGQAYRFTGFWQTRARFGNQFHAVDYQKIEGDLHGQE